MPRGQEYVSRIPTLRGRAGVECIYRLAIEIQEPDIDPGEIAVICFRWSKGDADDVEIADYHS
jgi:hypothetical protein